VQWSLALAWTVVAALAALGDAESFLYSPLILLGLTVVLIAFTYAFTKSVAGDGLISQHIFQEAGRRGLALAGAQQYVWDWHPQDRQLYVSEELEKALNHPPGTFRQAGSEALLDIMHPADRAPYLAALESAERRGRGFIQRDVRLQRGDGSYRWFELRARGMAGPDSRLVRAIGTLSDVTLSKRAEERLLNDAVYDQVTGLPNRALLIDRMTREINMHHVENLYVLVIDIDRFKDFNDGLGYEAGDGLLNVIGRRISALIDPEDTVARLPGNQFAVLVPGGNPNRGIPAFAEAIGRAVSQPISIKGQEVFLTASMGVARYRQLGQTAEQFLKDAAIALYEAKRRGNENIQFFQPSMRDDRGELVTLEGELRRAIERNEIEVHYQPIARLRDMDIAGFEALVRWRHPVLGLMPPENFLEVAEQTGMIRDIGRFVLNEATRQLGIWQRAFRPNDPVFMAVNVSASQLLETDLVSDIGSAIIREAVYRQTLKIEITESVLMRYPEKAAGLLERIKQLGVGLACDDFGTGYSSLSSLRHLPFDTLKVDRSFIVPDPSDDRAAIILESIIALAHDLGLKIVAEGIENQSQVDRLGSLMCDYGQGFFIGAPLTAKQVTETLAALPYVQDFGKTVISSLWERAEADEEMTTSAEGLSTAAIDRALREQSEERRREPAFGLAGVGAIEAAPPPGLSPMAPRIARTLPAPATITPRARKPGKREKAAAAAKSRKPVRKGKSKR
jgi:diguanylate cyclase (GGDEF)-like protein